MEKDIFGRDTNSPNDFSANGKKYRSLEEMPPDVRMEIEAKIRKMQNAPFADKMFTNGQLDREKMDALMKGGITKGFGLSFAALMAGIFLLTGGIIFAVFQIVQSSEETFELSGDPTHFDPVASFGAIKSHIGENAQFLSFDARYVRPDGTMDLTADYNPSTDYKFFVELPEAPKDAPPVGAGGNAEGKWYQEITADVYEPGQWRHVTTMGGGVSTEYSYQNKGIDLERGTPTGRIYEDVAEPPQCSLKELWDQAIKNGAPENAVASIDYDINGYQFWIGDAGFSMEFAPDCKPEE